MAAARDTAGKAPNDAPSGDPSGERPEPPKGGSGIKPPAAALDAGSVIEALDKLFEPIMSSVHRAIMAKAVAYTDVRNMHDQQRADRGYLLGALLRVAEAGQPAPSAAHPVEGLYIGEEDISRAYRTRLQERGLFLLPNVVWTMPADAAGNVIIEVEYAVADIEGRYWPAAVRVAGMGNDRVAQQRGGTGDKAMPRALSAAYKEAVCRLLGVAIPLHDPEAHDKAHLPLPPASPRPSNQQRGDRPPSMTMAEEDEFRDKVLDGITNAQSAAAIDRLMGRDDFKAKLKAVGSRTRKKIEDEAAECKQRLGGGEDRRLDDRRQDDRRDDRRQDSRREPERDTRDDTARDPDKDRRDRDQYDERSRGGRDAGTSRDGYDRGRNDDRGHRGAYGADLDDDIPF